MMKVSTELVTSSCKLEMKKADCWEEIELSKEGKSTNSLWVIGLLGFENRVGISRRSFFVQKLSHLGFRCGRKDVQSTLARSCPFFDESRFYTRLNLVHAKDRPNPFRPAHLFNRLVFTRICI